jgi:hypothetical protein
MKRILTAGFLGIFAAMIVAAPVFAVNWVRIGEGHYIDSDSIRPSTTYGSFTFDTRYLGGNSPLEEINGKKVWTINTNSYIDCKSAYGKTLTYTALDKDYKVVMRGKNVQKQWYGMDTPGSRGNESYTFVCTDRYLDRYHDYHRMWWY